MNTKLLLPALCFSGAALLFAPLHSSRAFTKINGSLGETQRDFRVFDNFRDTTANANTNPASQFPGQTGAELAIWKGAVEWSSTLHGDGTNDPLNNPLGSGGANFDPMFAGKASGAGLTNHNIVSSIADCGGGGTLAFTELPISDGWRIIYCDEWVWDDGPGLVGQNWDIQGVMTHEFGHALGLGHSGDTGATMYASASRGQTSMRSINADDIAGVQCKYGVASSTKPVIVATVANAAASSLTIFGSNFDATGNEVWLTSKAPTLATVDPIVRVANLSSTNGGTVITVPVPAAAGPGDVMVNKAGTGNSTLSNPFPTDLAGSFGTVPGAHPVLSSVTPTTIEALIPGTAETVVLSGTNLDLTTAVLLDGATVSPSRYTIVNATSITIDMPQASSLGAHTLAVTDGVVTNGFQVTIVATSAPRYELGTGDALNVVDRDGGLTFILAGAVGSTHLVVSSTSNLPSSSSYVNLDIGNNFASVFQSGSFTIPAAGWLQLTVSPGALLDPGPGGRTFYSQTIDLTFPTPFVDSNLQSFVLVQ